MKGTILHIGRLKRFGIGYVFIFAEYFLSGRILSVSVPLKGKAGLGVIRNIWYRNFTKEIRNISLYGLLMI